ncbi:MAG: MlaD family protein [Gordonia sp. (in: high G+C Gram-positive bacteria)]|uniref:MlaD family protein n=1 Tax=Gordonia sp. (in: high G+C Gram-positive bacteria) TaxID=84139 RepID=UPI0039E71883
MAGRRGVAALLAMVLTLVPALTGCGVDVAADLSGIGAQGTGKGSFRLTARIPSAAGLVRNAPVMIADTTVGSVADIKVDDWNALVTVQLDPGTKVPEGSHAMIGMTSVLGSSHLEIVPPDKTNGRYIGDGGALALPNCPDQQNIAAPSGPAQPDLNEAQHVDPCRYPTTEQVLSSLSVVLNGGGLSQVGDIVHELDGVVGGRADVLDDLIPRLNTLMTDLDKQTDDIIAATDGLDRLTAEINDQTPVVQKALTSGPQILQLMVNERQNLVSALDSVGKLSDTANQVMKKNGDDIKAIVPNLRELLGQLASTGPALTNSLRILLTFPFIEDTIHTVVKGDYVNSDLVLNLTPDRLSRSMMTSLALTGPEGLLGSSGGNARKSVDPLLAPFDPNGDKPAPSTKRGGR